MVEHLYVNFDDHISAAVFEIMQINRQTRTHRNAAKTLFRRLQSECKNVKTHSTDENWTYESATPLGCRSLQPHPHTQSPLSRYWT